MLQHFHHILQVPFIFKVMQGYILTPNFYEARLINEQTVHQSYFPTQHRNSDMHNFVLQIFFLKKLAESVGDGFSKC